MWAKHSHKLSPLPQFQPTTLRGSGRQRLATMASAVSRVAVIGGGISGAVCASILAGKGVSVTVFESGRGAGGRMAQRREVADDGKELFFDHGAPYFSVHDAEVVDIVKSWEARGLVVEWNVKFGVFDQNLSKFVEFEKEGSTTKYVGFPGMNSICRALCHGSGVEAKFGVTVGMLEWVKDKCSWSVTSLDGQSFGCFDGVVASDKNICSQRFTGLTGRSPPLDATLFHDLATDVQHVSSRSCFVLMLAFQKPLQSIPVKGFSFKNSRVLSWAFCDSSKPGRARASQSECWVLHSSAEYAAEIIARTGLQKLSSSVLAEIAEELFKEFERSGLDIPRPFFMKAHRWGSAFPMECIGGENKCLWNCSKKLAICGDFCASASVEGAVLSGVRAASKFLEHASSL